MCKWVQYNKTVNEPPGAGSREGTKLCVDMGKPAGAHKEEGRG